jgi:signal transduction histidine kinase
MTALSSLAILVIDDDEDTCANLRDILELDGCRVETARTIAEALDRQTWSQLVAIVLDRKLPDGSAEELLPRLKQLAPEAAVIIVTGYADLEGAIAAIRQGAADYILKPINIDLIRSRIAGIAERRRIGEENVRLNKDLQQRVNELQTLLDVIPIGIAIALDPACHRIRVNPSFARVLRLTPTANASLSAPVEERPPFRACRQGRELPAEDLPMQQAAARGVEVRNTELDIVHPDGTTINLLCYAAPLLDERGQPRGAVGAFFDITDRKLQQERTLQTERLAAIGQMVTGLAHESGNALARSQSCLEMLAWEVEDRPEALNLITRIQKAQDHLKHLYEEVRGYAAPLKLDRTIWDLSAIWRQAWENLALLRQGREARLQEGADRVDRCCPVDHFRLEQVFRNVFENALAACPDPVRIEVTCSEAEIGGHPAMRIAVRDNGPGLSPEQQQRIFEPFFTTKTKGTGLGMPIARRIVEAHGGQIVAGSPPGPGAEIVLTLPRETL